MRARQSWIVDHILISLRWEALFSRLPQRSFPAGVGIIVAWMFVIRMFLYPVHAYLDHTLGRITPFSTHPVSLPELLFDILILSPCLETLIHQKLVFFLAKWVNLWPVWPWTTIIFSSLTFGLAHFCSLGYILYTIPLGCVLAAAYGFGGCTRRTFWIVVVAHAVFNGLMFSMKAFDVIKPLRDW